MKYINPLLDDVIYKIDNKELKNEEVKEIIKLFKTDYILNKQKYLYD
jgi:hypothetical protein